MSDHRTSYQLPSHYVVEESHKDTDNATQPKQLAVNEFASFFSEKISKIRKVIGTSSCNTGHTDSTAISKRSDYVCF